MTDRLPGPGPRRRGSLFELLVTMEYLGAMADRRQGTLLFARFGMLQMLLAQQRRAAYERDKGHPLDAELAAMVEHHLTNDFTDFRANTKDGSVKWVSSWCGETRPSWRMRRQTQCGHISTTSCIACGLSRLTQRPEP
ncbi:hypothetical protein ACFWJE_07865 [Streptomyces griseoincarnatus]